jgi:hypothetical protein
VRRVADADQPGVRIAVVRNHAMDFALRGKLKQAEPMYAETPDAAFDLLRTGKVTVQAGIRPGLLTYSTRLPGSPALGKSNHRQFADPRRGWSPMAVCRALAGVVRDGLTSPISMLARADEVIE